MRWDNLLAEKPSGTPNGTGDPERPDPDALPRLFADGAVIRTFKTPEFRGMTFYEIEAKSILNHVKGDRFGFNHTINPYRGCSHSCSYCLQGDTPILMADGRTKPISDIEAGDEIYGTVREGNYRRYVKTRVLAHWSTTKPAYRITLEDGTELIASADHRFLSNRGWKHVTGSEQGPDQRPHLTNNNKLMGTGRFASAPRGGSEYRRGYLCGMIRGDGHLGSYSYMRPGRTHGNVHRFRLALTDLEALRRTRHYLADFEIETKEFQFLMAAGAQRSMQAIRTSSLGHVTAIEAIIRWPASPSLEWCKGFLAGIFDAEGSYSRGILRISNTDQEIIYWLSRCLRRLGFFFVVEEPRVSRPKPVKCIRLLGGIREHLRFFHTIDPAITRKRTIDGQAIKNNSPLRVVSIEPLGINLPLYDITTGTGDFIANGIVSHNCFARPTHEYLDMNAGTDFETKIVVKVNAVELLRRELRKPTWAGEQVAMGTNTDPYQRAEGHYKLMRGILTELNTAKNPYSILTKGTLIQRDLDLLLEGRKAAGISTNFSIGTVDEEVWRKTEPGTPHPMKRIEVVKMLNDAGIPCGVLMAPILPGISDSPKQLRETVHAIAEAGATHISPIILHLRPGVREVFLPWLEETYPHLVRKYEALYNTRSSIPKAVAEPVYKTVSTFKARYARPQYNKPQNQMRQPSEDPRPEPPKKQTPPETQLSLDLGSATPRQAPSWVKDSFR
jgi:DNA repair photolyase